MRMRTSGEYGVLPGLGMAVRILAAIHGYRFAESIMQKWRRKDSEID
jgi:hypothetical protein